MMKSGRTLFSSRKSIAVMLSLLVLASMALAFYAGYSVGQNQKLVLEDGGYKLVVQLPQQQSTEADEPSVAEVAPIQYIYEAFTKAKAYFYFPKDKPITNKDLAYGAVQGMLMALGDRYTRFLPPRDVKEFNLQMTGEFEGIGAELSMMPDPGSPKNRLTIMGVLPGFPAEKEGLEPMDRIIEIDGKSTDDMDLDEAVSRIRGPRGTKVTLTIQREGIPEPFPVTLIRERVQIKSVEWDMLEDGVGYLRIRQFNEKTVQELDAALDALKKQNPKALLLDLRSNPGGALDVAVEVAERFVKSGDIVAITDRWGNEKDKFEADGQDYKGLEVPMAVLVNSESASASEIVTGALKDHGIAKVIGQKTFGKASVQTVLKMSDGARLHVTTAHYLTPNRTDLSEKGIEPDFEIKPEQIGQNPKLIALWEQRAKEHLQAGELDDAFHCLLRARQLLPKDEKLKSQYTEVLKRRLKEAKEKKSDLELKKAIEVLKQQIK